MRKDITYNTHRKTIAPERNVTQLSGSVKGVSDPSLLFPRVYAERVRPRFLPARDFLAGILPKTALVKHCTYIVACQFLDRDLVKYIRATQRIFSLLGRYRRIYLPLNSLLIFTSHSDSLLFVGASPSQISGRKIFLAVNDPQRPVPKGNFFQILMTS